jgi:hypothetical protein
LPDGISDSGVFRVTRSVTFGPDDPSDPDDPSAFYDLNDGCNLFQSIGGDTVRALRVQGVGVAVPPAYGSCSISYQLAGC